MTTKRIEFHEVHLFACGCGEYVRMRFSKLETDPMYYVEFWHKKESRVDCHFEFDTRRVGKNLRVLLQDTRCESWVWFESLGYE